MAHKREGVSGEDPSLSREPSPTIEGGLVCRGPGVPMTEGNRNDGVGGWAGGTEVRLGSSCEE